MKVLAAVLKSAGNMALTFGFRIRNRSLSICVTVSLGLAPIRVIAEGDEPCGIWPICQVELGQSINTPDRIEWQQFQGKHRTRKCNQGARALCTAALWHIPYGVEAMPAHTHQAITTSIKPR